MLQNPRKTLGFKKNMVYKIPPGGGGKPYPASGLKCMILYCISKKVPKIEDIHERQIFSYIFLQS